MTSRSGSSEPQSPFLLAEPLGMLERQNRTRGGFADPVGLDCVIPGRMMTERQARCWAVLVVVGKSI